jgi:hypothetical protein
MSDKLHISNEMRQLDLKNRDFYDELTPEERKKFSTFLMIRWSSAVQVSNSSRDKNIEQYYLQSCNENLNKHFFAVSKHPKLQWLMATTVGPGDGTKTHPWIAPKKKVAGASAKRKALMSMYPHYKDDEIEVMMQIVSDKEIKQYIKDSGDDPK